MNDFPPNTEALANESDVEQKLLYPLLTAPEPRGAGYAGSEIRTKVNLRRLLIGKGATAKRYYPDYLVLWSGLPLVVVEAKAPGEDLTEALREARMYAMEVNSLFDPGLNPCRAIIVSDGLETWVGTCDSASPTDKFALSDISVATQSFDEALQKICRSSVVSRATGDLVSIRAGQRSATRPIDLLGGQTVRGEEVGINSFGATLAIEYRHIFSPVSRSERTTVARKAYVISKRRERYVDPIDRVIRAAAPPSVLDSVPIDGNVGIKSVVTTLKRGKTLEHQLLLLIGGVGAGKSTFVDYVREVALTKEVRARTTWISIDLNQAPLTPSHIYDWVCKEISTDIQANSGIGDVDDLESLMRLYAPEIGKLKKGPLKLLKAQSEKYNEKLYEAITGMQADAKLTANAMMRHACSERGRLAVLVLDNCDKRTRDEQLLMFQVAKWIQGEFQCLVFLPLRDVTYDMHRQEPPLDTALKDLVFYIEPPMFARVLERRVKLALSEIESKRGKTFTFRVSNSISVEYKAEDQESFLRSILASIYEHDRFVRRLMTGISGRDLRLAMELFLEFCKSGHIDENEILKIRQSEGRYKLPKRVVARVLLRMSRRFYDGDRSHLKNVFQQYPLDPSPSPYIRFGVLSWLLARRSERGPSGVVGYHRCSSILRDLALVGHSQESVRRELLYLLQARCVVAEHQQVDHVDDGDLVCLSPAGHVHLRLWDDVDYLAACAEDSWYSGVAAAERVRSRIADYGRNGHFSYKSTLWNARELVLELQGWPNPLIEVGRAIAGDLPVERPEWGDVLLNIEQRLKSVEGSWYEIAVSSPVGSEFRGGVKKVVPGGCLVELEPLGVLGFLPCLGDGDEAGVAVGTRVVVRVRWVNLERARIGLELVEIVSSGFGST